ncbi:MAG TPA: tripartite tricarboxylate transporter substrate-binding protein [Burkholderiaceae bacterium]|nr:tripartite tricarboxylate transporter substrate-binding protein [Burkholderiaceae bacterium]
MFVRSLLGALALACAVAATPAAAQGDAAWPSRPVRVVVPFPPGGGIDVMVRALGQELSQRWGQPVVIENKAGAGSLIGAELVARAPADGYTLLATVNQTMIANRFLYKSLPYDPDRSFEPIMMLAISDQFLLAHTGLAANDLKEAVALARKQPGGLNYGSFGNGSQPHLLYETLRTREGIELTHVPYKGIAPNLTALAAGEVVLGTGSLAVAQPMITAGRIKPIAVAGSRRVPQFPNVPTVEEQGYPYAKASIWYALFAPAGTPAAITDRIRNDVRAILNDPAFAAANATSKGLTVVAGDRAQLEKTIADDTRLTAEQVKAAKVTPE